MKSNRRLFWVGVALLYAAGSATAQQQPLPTAPSPVSADQAERPYNEKNLSTVLLKTEQTKTRPTNEFPKGLGQTAFFGTYRPHLVPLLQLENPDRLSSLIHNGRLHLSLHDALLLAIENNLDVELQRYQLVMADTDLLRARGGGAVRGLPLTVAQAPVGVGGPGSPLLNSAATAGAVSPTASTVANVFDLNQLTEAQTNLSIQSNTPFSAGPAVPSYDPTLIGQLAGLHLEPNDGTLVTDNTFTNLSLGQGFSTGLQVLAGVNNASDILTSGISSSDPFRRPNVIFSIMQPLFRGAGTSVNRRYIRIAENNLKVSRLVFRQQLIDMVYGVSRLYYDLVSLNEDVKVKEETLTAAQQLYDNDKSQVEVGMLAPIELTRAQALVAASQLDLTRAQGLVTQQEAVVKTMISRTGTAAPLLANVRIVPTDTIVVPQGENLPSLPDLIKQALANRPDLAQAAVQVRNGEITLRASRNLVRPEIDLIGTVQTRGILGSTAITSISGPPLPPSLSSTRTSKVYEAGIQISVPFRNRIAQADAARDQIQFRQMQARLQLLENQARDEIENSFTAVQVARQAYAAAVRSREYQEQLLDAEKQKLSVGASVNFFVVQDESYLAQARSTEVVARSTYIKARISLERAIGSLLESSNIVLDDAISP
jgi:outer membrane protein TolC